MQLLLATSSDPTAGAYAAIAAMSGVFLLCGLAITVFMIWIYYLIFKKTGMNPWLSLLMLVPVAGFVVPLILAFAEWPIERENRALRAQLGMPAAGAPPGATIVQA
ncbi:MAG: hypothetical protein JWO85_2493 [Candidatus Eremiobacteraeota bacterium]|jgi:uncharacterized membrane protein YhaH (DUF805 family)|nr:hypothetical protein [Candidatus Eremiobacteraeota bacterium]